MSGSLLYRVVLNSKVQAYEPPLVKFPNGFKGGPVLDADLDAPLRHTRGWIPQDSFRPDANYNKFLKGDYIYAGPIYNHFGHFMAEMVHRIIPAKRLDGKYPFIFVSTFGLNPFISYDKFPSFIKEILDFLEIFEDDLRIISENSIVERLHIIEAGSDLDGGPKPGYLEMLCKFTDPRLDSTFGSLARLRSYTCRGLTCPQLGIF